MAASREHCAGPVDIPFLVEAADALLEALAADERGDSRRPLTTAAHDFIDLARCRSVRQAAYPAEGDRPGALLLDRIIQLMERADFTVGRMFRQRAAQYTHKTLFVMPQDERATELSWEQVEDQTRRIAAGVLALLGEDPRVAIFTPNRVEGALFDLACLSNGIFDTLIPSNVVESQLEHILVDSGARMLVVSGSEQIRSALDILESLPVLEWVVTLDPLPATPAAKVVGLDELMNRGKEIPPDVLERRVGRVRSGELATTMYTSGTTGVPKGIKFTHLNLVAKRFARAFALPDTDEHDVLVCYLPLYHTFGRYLEMLGAVHLGATYVFAGDPSTETLIRQMQRFQPTGLISVPKKWLDVYHRVMPSDQPPESAEAVERALRELTGDRLRWGLSAAGHLDSAIFRFFQRHGIDLMSGYGMTEATGGITMSPPGQYVDGTIGRALPAINLRVSDDGELLLRGPYVTVGYTGAQDNAAAFRDGWLCTGDIVACDSRGYFRHVDRKKDIYKNARGRTVAPQRIEGLFADFPEVSRVFTVGDGQDYMTLLIRPNLSYGEVALDAMSESNLREYFRGLVVACNRFLAPFERVVNFALIDRDFSMDKGELTPKGSFRRSAVVENFREVIEPMYISSAIERVVGGIRVRVPVMLLQHLGATEAGTVTDDDGLVFRAVGKQLRIRRDATDSGRVWIGNCCYDAVGETIDLDDWLRIPELWVGNAELTHITGESILLWSLSRSDRITRSRRVRVAASHVPSDEWRARLDAPPDEAPSLLTVHAAAVTLFGGENQHAYRAIDYLVRTMRVGRVRYQELSESLLQNAAFHDDLAVRSRAFAALLAHQPDHSFNRTASLFCESLLDFLDEEACTRIARVGVRPEQWRSLSEAFASLRRRVAEEDTDPGERFAVRLLRALGRISELKPSFYLPVRRELAAWMLSPVSEAVRDAASDISDELTAGFRWRLGKKRSRASDPKTGRSYTWKDTLQAEDGIDEGEFEQIAGAFQHTELVREAVYLLSQQGRIDLTDLPPKSVWLSFVETRFGRSVYHVAIQLRNYERVEFIVYVRGAVAAEKFRTDLCLMCAAAGHWGESPLTLQLGGYWPEYGIATLGHVPGEPVEALIRHMHDHPDRDVRQRLKDAWRHLCWSALTAAFEFHRRTGSRWMLAGNVARDIHVPLNDFEENARVLSAAAWQPFSGCLDMILRLKRAFLDRVRFYYPSLASETDEELLLAAVVEAYGPQEGMAFLRDALLEAERAEKPDEETVAIRQRIGLYVDRISKGGYMPKSLYFAIARYLAWSEQVPDASLHAQAAQLQELQHSYHLDAVTHRFPEARLWLYVETVLCGSPPEAKRTLEQAMRSLRTGADIKQVLGGLYTELKEKLPALDQQFFLTRAAYPHLELDEKAELLTTAEVGPDRAELVTAHTDRTGGEIRVRPVASSAEVDTLYRIFYAGGLAGGLTGHERLLVAVDSAGYVLGGIGYVHRTPYHALLDKVAVLPRCRHRGIGRLLLHEHLRRQAAEGVAVVSAEFVLVDWLAQFGFRPDPRYPGVVLHLAETDWSAGFAARE